jgi:signal transduction histidine kinase
LTTFDEWRGGCGLSLAVARRVIVQHGGQLWSPASGAKAAAVVVLPHA